jgi:hypothetical protein
MEAPATAMIKIMHLKEFMVKQFSDEEERERVKAGSLLRKLVLDNAC